MEKNNRQQPITPEPEKPRVINGKYIVDETPVVDESVEAKEPAEIIIWKLENSYDFRGNINGITATNPQTGERYVSNNGSDWKKAEPVETDYARGRADMQRECVGKISKECHLIMKQILVNEKKYGDFDACNFCKDLNAAIESLPVENRRRHG